MSQAIKPRSATIRCGQLAILAAILLVWQLASRQNKFAFFFGEPLQIAHRLWAWFVTDADIYRHLGVTLAETGLAFFIGTTTGLALGLWLGLSRSVNLLLDPYIRAANAMPRVILAPIFSLWFGLGMGSKVALAVTLVFFIVFFNVHQGVREVSPILLQNARMLGARPRHLLRHVYLPSATSWVFSSLHSSVGLAFVGAVVGEYLGSANGVGYLILQAQGTFDVNAVFAGIIVLSVSALALDFIVSVVEQRLLRWQPKSAAMAQSLNR